MLTTACTIGISFGALAQANLILNPIFNQGNNGGVPTDWSSSAGGNYNYLDKTAPSYAVGGQIYSFGWWDGVGIWQNTGASIQANVSYDLSVAAEVGQSPLTGVTLSFQDVTKGWTSVASQEFLFSTADQNSGQYETFTLSIPQSDLTSLIGDTIGVGVNLNENPNTQYGWVHLDNVSLVAVPEPGATALLTSAACGVVLFLCRKNQRRVTG